MGGPVLKHAEEATGDGQVSRPRRKMRGPKAKFGKTSRT